MRLTGACCLLGFVPICFAMPAFAEPDDNDAGMLSEIVVTATKRETPLQETPLAVSAFSSDILRSDRISTIADLGSIAPDVTINGRAQGAETPISIRGVGSDVLGLGADDAVAVYLDGVYEGRQYGAVSELPGVDRIEVLRGPQGTLYGRNATGGAISVVSKDPSTTPDVAVDAGYGTLNERFVSEYATTGIINDSAAVSLAAAYRQRDGYSFNTYNDRYLNDLENWDINGAVKLLSVERLRLILRGDVGVLRSSFQGKDITNGDGNPDVYDVNFPGQENRNFGGLALTAEYDLGLARITSITATRRASYYGIYDSDGTAQDLFRIDPYYEDQHQFSEELRLASSTSSRFQWLVGGYFFRERASGVVDIPFIVYASTISLVAANRTRSAAAFGEVSYQITDELKATAGFRYSSDHKSFDFQQNATGPVFPSVPFSNSINDAHAVTPRYVVDYKIAPDVFTYMSASRGFRSGGFSAINPLPYGTPPPFYPEYVWAYELGLKSEFLEHRLRSNNAIFYYDYTNMQVRTSDQYGFVVIQNAASSHIKGAETEFELRPDSVWDFGVNLSYLDARYVNYVSAVPGLTVTDESGHFLNRAPRWSTSAWIQPTVVIPGGHLTLRTAYWYKSTLYYTEDNVQPYGTGPTGELQARLTYAPDASRWSFSLYGSNLTDRRWRTSVFDVVGHPQALFNEPRLAGFDVHMAF